MPVVDMAYVNVYGRDITERKKTEEMLQDATEKWFSLTENTIDTIVVTDNQNIIRYINKTIPPTIPEGVIGTSVYEYVAKEHHDVMRKSLKKVYKTGEPDSYEVTLDMSTINPELGTLWFSTKLVPIKNDKEITGIIMIATDITERKKAEEEIKQYSEHLEELIEEKTQELKEAERMATIGETAGMVGHDLRNPLQAIVNTIYLANMKLKSLPSELEEKREVKKYLDTVERQVGYMNKIVSDLLDYARPIHPDSTETSIHQLIQGTLLSMNIPETIDVSVVVPEKMKLKIDSTLMRRVFINLITNAVQAMPDGGKLMIKASEKVGEVFISVKDTGIGICEDNLPKLFQPLFTTKSKGQGFGLPVCKKIIDAHDGEIIIKSKVGKGSTFIVKISI
jgi:PAS domain S-box-containing protein